MLGRSVLWNQNSSDYTMLTSEDGDKSVWRRQQQESRNGMQSVQTMLLMQNPGNQTNENVGKRRVGTSQLVLKHLSCRRESTASRRCSHYGRSP